jgi:hypothetical protein
MRQGSTGGVLQTAGLLMSLTACGGGLGGNIEGGGQEVVPTGVAATFLANNLPANLSPSEQVTLTVQIKNSGTVDWVKGAGWSLHWAPGSTFFGWSNTPLPTTVLAGGTISLAVPLVVPSGPASTNFVAQMAVNNATMSGLFGPKLSIPVTIGAAVSHPAACAIASPTIGQLPLTYDSTITFTPFAFGWGTYTSQVVTKVVGTNFYLADLAYFRIFDLSTPAAPRLVATVPLHGAPLIYDLKIVGTRAYLAREESLVVVDLAANPPAIIGDLLLPAGPVVGNHGVKAIDVVGNIVYMAGLHAFATIDATNPAAMRIVARVISTEIGPTISVVGSTAYMGGSNVVAYDVSDPVHPRRAGAFGSSTAVADAFTGFSAFQFAGSHLYAVARVSTPVSGFLETDLRVFDLSTPSTPAQVGVVANIEDDVAQLSIVGDRLLAFDPANFMFELYDLTNPTQPVLRSRRDTVWAPALTAGAVAYLFDGPNDYRLVVEDMRVYGRRVAATANVALQNGISNGAHLLYGATTGLNEIDVIDTSNPLLPIRTGSIAVTPIAIPNQTLNDWVGTYLGGGGSFNQLVVKALAGNRLYVLNGPQLQIYDVSTAHPRLLGTSGSLLQVPSDVVASNGYAYVVDALVVANDQSTLGTVPVWSRGAISLDVHDPANIRRLGGHGAGDSALSAVLDGSVLAVAAADGITFLSIGDPANPAFLSLDWEATTSFSLLLAPNHVLYAGGSMGLLRVIDISNAARPHELGATLGGTFAYSDQLLDSMIAFGGTNVIQARYGEVMTYDVSDPTWPKLILDEDWPTSLLFSHLFDVQGYLLLAGKNGTTVVDYCSP